MTAVQTRVLVNFLDAVSIENNQLNLLMFGPGGHGRSSTANSILGRKGFPASTEGSGVNKFTTHDAIHQKYTVSILDVPPARRQMHGINTDVIGLCNYFMPWIGIIFQKGCHAPILVLKFGFRFEPTDFFSLVMLRHMFGQKFIRDHCVCVITCGDKYTKEMSKTKKYKNFEDWCKGQKGTLGDIFEAISYRCVLFNNKTRDPETKESQKHQLMSMIIGTWRTPKTPQSMSPQKRTNADVHAFVETAANREDYKKQLALLVNYTKDCNFDQGQLSVSVTIYGASEHLHFAFKEFANHEDFAKKLHEAPYLEGSCGTDKVLALARVESFGPNAGCRADSKQIALIITEGKTEDVGKTLEEADELKSSGVIIMTAGANKCGTTTENGDDYRKLMHHIASHPNKAFIADDYNSLTELSEPASHRTCEIAPEFPSTADVLFIVDSSISIGTTDYKKELDFVVNLTECFNIGSDDARFSVMIFSSSPELLFDFSLNTHKEIKEATLNAPFMDRSTNTAEALDLARTSPFGTQDETRNKKIAIVITDGKSNDSNATSDAAGRLEETGVLIMAIGVGNANRRELERIVSRPEDIYMVDNYDVLKKIHAEIAKLTRNYENITGSFRQRGDSPERHDSHGKDSSLSDSDGNDSSLSDSDGNDSSLTDSD